MHSLPLDKHSTKLLNRWRGSMNFLGLLRSKLVVLDRQPSVSFSLLRVSVLARIGVVTVVAAVLWLAILWALA